MALECSRERCADPSLAMRRRDAVIQVSSLGEYERMSTKTQVLEHFFAAINRNDVDAITVDFDPEIVRIEPEGFPTAGTYRGVAEVREHVRHGRGTWAEGSCDAEKILVNGDKAVVYLHARVRLKQSNEWIDGRFADGFVFRNGRIIEYRSFATRTEALQWAGIAE